MAFVAGKEGSPIADELLALSLLGFKQYILCLLFVVLDFFSKGTYGFEWHAPWAQVDIGLGLSLHDLIQLSFCLSSWIH